VLFRTFVVNTTTSKLLGGITDPALIVVCAWLSVSSTILQPETSTEKGLGLKSSTHSGVVASAPVLGINSLINTAGELDSTATGRSISAHPHTTSSSEKIRREYTDIHVILRKVVE
jgi:hypothetical protein